MEEEQDISKLSDYISGLEASIQKKDVYYVDISSVFKSLQHTIIEIPETREENNALFESLQQYLFDIEAAKQHGGSAKIQQLQQGMQPIAGASQNEPVVSRQPFPSDSHPLQESALVSSSAKQQGILKGLSSLETEIAKIDKEIKKITASEIKNFSEIKTSLKPGAKGSSILVTLSLQDQISELEKIIIGLNSGSFNKEQIRIVTQELNALNKAVQSQTAQIGIGQELTGLRNSRLEAAMHALEDAKHINRKY